MIKNECYTYFKIVGNFKTEEITKLLNLSPDKKHDIGELRRDGKKYDFAMWSIGRCDEYDVYTDNQMKKTILKLLDKIDILNSIRSKFDVEFYLEVVPTIVCGGINPCLAPSLDVIDFCHATRTNIDIDLYLIDEK